MKRISILGATGSVGTSTLDLVARNPARFEVAVLTACHNWRRLAELALAHRAKRAVIADGSHYQDLKQALQGSGIEVAAGADALVEAALAPADLVVAAIVGAAGLRPTLAALQAGTSVALANKEALVCAGSLMTGAARQSGAKILPIDSEHNAIFQVLEESARVRRVWLTASGGPFRTWTAAEMAEATPEQAVCHPVWSMGAKISVDSATLMNKGLELIEAMHLFGLQPSQLGVLVHPQSLVHRLVEYVDGSQLAQRGPPDMRVPIANALAFPERIETPAQRLDLAAVGRLEFEEPDRGRFPALGLAESAMAAGKCRPCVLNAANEEAVAAFLDRRISFTAIAVVVEETLATLPSFRPERIEDIFEIDREARSCARQLLAGNRQRWFVAPGLSG